MVVTAEYDKKMGLPTAVGISNSTGHGNGAPILLGIANPKGFHKLLLCRGIYLLALTSLRTSFTRNLRRVISLDSGRQSCGIMSLFFFFFFTHYATTTGSGTGGLNYLVFFRGITQAIAI